MRIALCVLVLALGGCGQSVEDSFLEACENVFKTRLRSPSTYVRREEPNVFSDEVPQRSIEDVRSELDELQAEYDENEDPSLEYDIARLYVELANIQSGKPAALRYRAFIKYDADNAYGTPIAGIYECEGEWDAESGGWLDEGDLLINGMTRMDHLESLVP